MDRPPLPHRPALAVALAAALFAVACAPAGDTGPRLSAVEALGSRTDDAEPDRRYARAEQPREFVFPADHGPHPDYQTEWWYLTGHLDSADGQRFGFQWTVFRRAVAPEMAPRASDWASRQLYLGHFAVTDVARGRHHSFERFSRGAAGLAGARAEPFAVWLEDWRMESLEEGDLMPLAVRAAQDGVAMDLRLESAKPLVLQGDRGLSRKNATAGGASYYYSFTRLPASGTVTADGRTLEVRGEAWLDREWSTSVLAPGQLGWDWFSLQLDDGRELMYYQLRLDDGGVDAASSGLLVQADGSSRYLARDDVQLRVLERWRSPRGGAEYPSRWRMTLAEAGLDLEVVPVLADQEMDVSFRYWEGAVDARPATGAGPSGRGYVELVGYAE